MLTWARWPSCGVGKGGRLVLPRAGAGEKLLIVLPLGLCHGKLYSVAVLPSKALRVFDDLQQSLVLFIMTVRLSVFLAMSVGEAPRLRFVWLQHSQGKIGQAAGAAGCEVVLTVVFARDSRNLKIASLDAVYPREVSTA